MHVFRICVFLEIPGTQQIQQNRKQDSCRKKPSICNVYGCRCNRRDYDPSIGRGYAKVIQINVRMNRRQQYYFGQRRRRILIRT